MSGSPRRDSNVVLDDGRDLAFCEWGDPDGPAVLAFHGSPGSRLWWPGEALTSERGVRLVTVDRPGYGGSTALPGRPVGAGAGDIAALTAALGIDRFGVVGWSGGAPYAAALAAAMPERLTGVCLTNSMSLVYGLGPANADGEIHEDDAQLIDMIERLGPAEATLRYADELRQWADDTIRDPDSLIGLDALPDGDRWLLTDQESVGGLFASIREGLKQGSIGAASDWVALLAPWGFTFSDVEMPVRLWHGAQDRSVPQAEFERAAAAFPQGHLTVWPDAGHFGTAKHWGDVLAAALG